MGFPILNTTPPDRFPLFRAVDKDAGKQVFVNYVNRFKGTPQPFKESKAIH